MQRPRLANPSVTLALVAVLGMAALVTVGLVSAQLGPEPEPPTVTTCQFVLFLEVTPEFDSTLLEITWRYELQAVTEVHQVDSLPASHVPPFPVMVLCTTKPSLPPQRDDDDATKDARGRRSSWRAAHALGL